MSYNDSYRIFMTLFLYIRLFINHHDYISMNRPWALCMFFARREAFFLVRKNQRTFIDNFFRAALQSEAEYDIIQKDILQR